MKITLLFGLPLIAGALHAQQQPGVNCVPIQGQGWTGCDPNYQPQPQQPQQPQAPQPPPAQWVSSWGAIATDEPKGILGAVTGRLTKVEAQQAAMADCSAKGGSPCKLEIAYDNECVALVVGTQNYSINTGATADTANQLTMKTCSSNGDTACHVYYSACSLPSRIQ